MRFLLANHKFAAPSRFRPELVNVDQLDWSSFSETKRKRSVFPLLMWLLHKQ
ncbi:hypothetical protein V6Z11_A10G260800 [Gossypium hirsutum]